MRDTDEIQKKHCANQLRDIEYSDIEHLPMEDVAAIVERRHEQELQAVREIQTAVTVLMTAFSQQPEDKRREAARGLSRMIEAGDADTVLAVIEDSDTAGLDRRARDAAARRTTDGEER